MEIDIPFSIFISALGIIVTVAIAHVRQQDKISRILALADTNHAIHANPEESGIGTTKTNELILMFRDVVKDFEKSNREALRDVKISMDNITRSTDKLTMMIELQNKSN